MPVARQKDRPKVPARPLFSELPAPPGVYRSVTPLAERTVYYALGSNAVVMRVVRPDDYETDEEVVARLMVLTYEDPRVPTLALVSADALTASGFSPSFHRPLALPRLALSPPGRPPAPR